VIATTTLPEATTAKVERLNTASARRVIEPDRDVAGSIGDGQLLPDELLSIAGLDLDLSAEQRRTLAREEVASITESGIRFEAVLEAGFALEVLRTAELTDPRVTYLLHEVGEETRHQRLFVRLLEQCAPTARNPFRGTIAERLLRRVVRRVITMPATFHALVLAGEEMPDLLQKLASEHPQTDPFIRQVNRYHRMEEARHLSFARLRFAEVWRTADRRDRFALRHVAPRLIAVMFGQLVHPGVYAMVGLPAMQTWRAANRSPQRRQLRADACRPVLDAVIAAGAIHPARIPKPWRHLVQP
jgi:hypothetical protein